MTRTLLTTTDAAEMLNVSDDYIHELTLTGVLTAVDGNQPQRFACEDVRVLRDRMRADRTAALARLVPEDGYDPSDF